jgi:arsenical pump membrane protein
MFDFLKFQFQSTSFVADMNCELPQEQALTWKSYVLLIVFLVMLIPVAVPIQVRLPHWLQKYKWIPRSFSLNYWTSASLSTLLLIMMTVISWQDIQVGIVGNSQIQPYAILILFMSLTYICVSVDCTGVLEYVAVNIALKASTSYLKLYIGFYLFNSLLTLVLSNDVLILTMTPLIVYVCGAVQLDPLPMLMTEFMTANTWSIALMIGNPTNLIVAIAYQMQFLEYSKWMILPATVAALVTISIVYAIYYYDMPRSIIRDDYKLNSMLSAIQLDPKWSIWTSAAVLIGCLTMLAASSAIKVAVWIITLSFCMISLIKDSFIVSRQKNLVAESEDDAIDMASMHKSVNTSSSLEHLPTHTADTAEDDPGQEQSVMINRAVLILSKRVPWDIMPFILCMFIMVESLDSNGWLSRLAFLFHQISAMQVYSSAILMTLLSALLCVVMNNQPMTILMTKILIMNDFRCGLDAQQQFIASFSVIIGSNLGGNLALNGALAGLMWRSVLSMKKVKSVTYLGFMRDGFTATIPALLLSAVALAGLESVQAATTA